MTDYAKPARWRPFTVKGNVASTQAKGCWGCLHIGTVAVYLWTPLRPRTRSGWRLEVLTPCQRFRFARGRY